MVSDLALELLADLVEYPDAALATRIERARAALAASRPEVAARLALFAARTAPLEAGEVEEIYARAFDFNPDGALEIGWHLHGETYQRGAYLLRLRELRARTGVSEGSELPDHLPGVLRAIARLPDGEERRALAADVGRAAAKIAKALQECPYVEVVAAVRDLCAPDAATAPMAEVA